MFQNVTTCCMYVVYSVRSVHSFVKIHQLTCVRITLLRLYEKVKV